MRFRRCRTGPPRAIEGGDGGSLAAASRAREASRFVRALRYSPGHMPDSRILDRARLGQELDELQAEQQGDMYEGVISPREVSEFEAVAAALKAVLEEAEVGRMSQEMTPARHTVVGNSKVESALALLSPAQREAVEKLLTAATAHDADRGTYVSALERNTLLNQALMHLQPLLALALRPDYRDGRSVYQGLVAQISDVRKDIMSGILSQGMEHRESTLEVDITQDAGDEDEPDAGALADPDLGPDAASAGSAALADPDLDASPGASAGPSPDANPGPSPDASSGIEQDIQRTHRRQDREP
jgi:hypothetical protein